MFLRYQPTFFLACLFCSSLAAMDPTSSAAAPSDDQQLTLLQREAAQSISRFLEQLNFELKMARINDLGLLEKELQPSQPLYKTMLPIFILHQMHPQPFTREESQKIFPDTFLSDLEAIERELPQKVLKNAKTCFDKETKDCADSTAQMVWNYDLTYVTELMNGINRYMRENKTYPLYMVIHLAERVTMLLAIAQEHPELPYGQNLLDLSKKLANSMPVWRNKEERARLDMAADDLADKTAAYEIFLQNKTTR